MEHKLKQCGKAIHELISKKNIDKALTTVKGKNFEYKLFFQEIGMTEMPPDQVRIIFETLDIECRVFIEDELSGFMTAFDPTARKLTPDEVAAMMKDGDPHNEGKIGLAGFLAMVEKAKNQA